MKQMLLAIFTALLFEANAQITVTAATFPSAGDTLEYAVDTDPAASLSAAIATPPGGNQTWNLLDLQADQTSQIIYQPAGAGMNAGNFPGADLVVIGAASETYYDLTSTKFKSLGFAGATQGTFGLQLLAKYSPALTERTSPLNFFDITQQSTNLSLPFAVPPGLLDSFNLPISPDSLRTLIGTQRLDVVDGWGKCQIPGGIYDVLRVKRTEYRTTGLEVKLPFIGWVNISTFLGGGGGGGGLGNFLGTDTTVTYHFLNNLEKADIAVATMNNDLSAVSQVQFKNNAITPTLELDSPGAASIQAYPNPAVEFVRFNCSNLPQGDYTLKIFNIIGKVVWKENYQLTGSKSIRIELDDFKKGTYLYSLSDNKGNIIGTKRLVILKP